MKKLIGWLLFFLCVFLLYNYRNEIRYYAYEFIFKKDKAIEISNNSYTKDLDISFLNTETDLKVKNKEDFKNLLYTLLNSGNTELNIYCDFEYKDCIYDFVEFASDKVMISNINNFVSPYNSFNNLEIRHDNYINLTFKVRNLYSKEDITMLEQKVESVYNSIIKDDMDDRDRIKAIHDYIINNVTYDKLRIDNPNDNTYRSNTAMGVLFENMGICSGYSDTMALFLDYMNIPNYKISSTTHVWNLVYIDNKWLHLDLTWDDPITSTGVNILDHRYFLIDTETLESYDDGEHQYMKDVFIEAK